MNNSQIFASSPQTFEKKKEKLATNAKTCVLKSKQF